MTDFPTSLGTFRELRVSEQLSSSIESTDSAIYRQAPISLRGSANRELKPSFEPTVQSVPWQVVPPRSAEELGRPKISSTIWDLKKIYHQVKMLSTWTKFNHLDASAAGSLPSVTNTWQPGLDPDSFERLQEQSLKNGMPRKCGRTRKLTASQAGEASKVRAKGACLRCRMFKYKVCTNHSPRLKQKLTAFSVQQKTLVCDAMDWVRLVLVNFV